MKYLVELELKKNEMRTDYRRIFISFFKKAISEYMEGHFFEEVYNSGAKRKDLVWSVKFSKPAFKGAWMQLEDGRLILTLKIGDVQTALIYYSSLLGMKGRDFPLEADNAMRLKRIKLMKENEIVEDVAVFKVHSPICLRLHDREKNKDRYVSIGDDDFEDRLRENLSLEVPQLKEEIDNLEFDCSALKRVIVPAFNVKIPGSIGSIAMRGDKRVLNHILKCGLGSRRNSGFGLLENVLK